MQIGLEEAALLTLLTQLMQARAAVEVGTFTGMSSLAIGRGLADGGKLICFDISAEYTSIAQRYWKRAGIDDRIELRLGPAAERLSELPDEPHLDIAFIDADKEGYASYWAALVPRMRAGGLIMVDNVLWSGKVTDPDGADATTGLMIAFNDAVVADPRVEAVMLPIADGLTLARKL
jgi:caffeoyl-CoA O-methyltransferase